MVTLKQRKEKLINSVKANTNKIWKPKYNEKYVDHSTNSWFDMKTQVKRGRKSNREIVNITAKEKEKYKCITVSIVPNKKQRKILNRWFNAYTTMYNETLKYIKQHINDKDFTLDYKKIRNVDEIKRIKYDIHCNSYGPKLSKDVRNANKINRNYGRIPNIKGAIPAHTIVNAIQLAVANYKSALSNYKNGNIKKFRIRYWKYGRTILTMGFEKCYFSGGMLCGRSLGKLKTMYDGREYDLNNVTKDSTMGYNAKTNEYNLYVPYDADNVNVNNLNRNNFISMDPGIRTFLTCLTNNNIVKIGDNIKEKIGTYIDRLDNTSKIENKRKRKQKQDLYRRKIRNLVDDLHYKTIKYLVTTNDNILIGNMSVKGIISRNNNLNSKTKRIASALSFYKFKQRLAYKCTIYNVGFKEVNEAYTSKTCSVCGNVDNNLGSKKIYDCNKCTNKMDRDVNGARCILFASLE